MNDESSLVKEMESYYLSVGNTEYLEFVSNLEKVLKEDAARFNLSIIRNGNMILIYQGSPANVWARIRDNGKYVFYKSVFRNIVSKHENLTKFLKD